MMVLDFVAESQGSEKQEMPSDALKNVSGNRLLRESREITRNLVELLKDPANWALLKASQSTVRLSKYNLAFLSRLESETALRSHNECVSFLVETLIRTRDMALPATTELIFIDDRPTVLTGQSGSGKTLYTKTRLLPSIKAPVFILDVVGEYTGIRKITLSDLFSLKWQKADESTRIRFVPNNNTLLADSEVTMLFDRLNVVKKEGFQPNVVPSGQLSKWVIITEESHRLLRSSQFTDFLSESRKFCRKILVISNNTGPFRETARILLPPPLEQLLNHEMETPE